MSGKSRELMERFERFSTDQLQDIYHENNQKEFSRAELRAVRELLESYGVAVPDQLEFPRTSNGTEPGREAGQEGETATSQLDIARGESVDLQVQTVKTLRAMAKQAGLRGYSKMSKAALIEVLGESRPREPLTREPRRRGIQPAGMTNPTTW